MKSSLRSKFLVAVALVAICGLAAAQDQYQDQYQNQYQDQGQNQSQDQVVDPPSRVVRLQFMDGQVSLQPGGVDDWVAANLNRPLTTADRIWTDRDSRAELTMASAALRMGSETSVTLTNLDDNTAQIELDQGVLNLSVRYLNAGEIVEVDTPNFAYTVTKPGDYRFEVLPEEDQSWITVRHGDGEATGQGNAVRVHGGQQFRFSAGQSLSYTSSGAGDSDGFDDWCAVREKRESSSASASYVAAGTVGYEDLDDNGNWERTATYGAVWYPRVRTGWAPYRDGHWAWVEPWGWTWVDDAPWGFAPFHYGRWVCNRDRWGWIPGPVGVRPVYAPALVGWVGGSNWGVSIGVGGGGVGWFPLGWRDPYLPSYRVSPRYARNVNISNSREVNITTVNNYYTTTNVNARNRTINNIRYENVGMRGAVTGVSTSTFASGKSVGRNSVVVPSNAVGRSNMMTSAAVVPTKEAVLGGRPPAAAPQHIVAPRRIVSKVAPPPRPVSFEQQRPLLEKSNGVPLSMQTRNDLRKSSPAPAPRGGRPVGNSPAGNQIGGRGTNQPGGNQGRPPVNQPGANQQGRPLVNQPGANQQGRPLVNQPGANQQGRPPVVNRPGSDRISGRSPAENVPSTPQRGASPANGNPGAGNMHGQPNNSPNTFGRPVTPATPPENRNQPPADANRNGAPGRNVPRPPQAGGNVYPSHAPATTLDNTGRAPVTPRTSQGNQGSPYQVPQDRGQRNQVPQNQVPQDRSQRNQVPQNQVPQDRGQRNQAPQYQVPQDRGQRNQEGNREVAPARNGPPVRPVSPPPQAPPARTVAPAQPPRSAPPARTVAPAPPPRNTPPARTVAPEQQQQRRNPPPPKENKEKEKEQPKDR